MLLQQVTARSSSRPSPWFRGYQLHVYCSRTFFSRTSELRKHAQPGKILSSHPAKVENEAIKRPVFSGSDSITDSKPEHEVKQPRVPRDNRVLNVCLVGRPNTGKSTLFNRLTNSRKAIVSNVPGTTRDRREGDGYIAGLPLRVIDTGGLDDRGIVSTSVVKQVEKALVHTDIVLFLLDGRAGVTALDRSFANWIRSTIQSLKLNREVVSPHPTQIVLAANKTEGGYMSEFVMNTVADAYSLGFGEPLLISATHGDGMTDLAEVLIDAAKKRGQLTEAEDHHRRHKQSSRAALDATKPMPIKDSEVAAVESIDLSIDVSTDVSTDESGNSRQSQTKEERSPVIQLAIMGRPNVGKSTLLNAMVREERVITGPTPGLTRDAIHVEWTFNGRSFRLVDTAGLTRLQTDKKRLEGVQERKNVSIAETIGKHIDKSVILPGIHEVDVDEDPSQFSAQISEMALISALNALRFAQVVMIVVEASQGKFSKIDLQLARKCLEEGRGVFIAANKFDIAASKGVTAKEYERQVMEHTDEYFREFGKVPVIVCSGTLGKGVSMLLKTAIAVHDSWDKRISTWVLNNWLKDLLVATPPPRVGEKALKVKYMTQLKTRPPQFALFTNMLAVPQSFERFLRSRLQTDFKLRGVPIRFIVRKAKGNEVKRHLLAQGKHSRRGVGKGESKGRVGPKREKTRMLRKIKKVMDKRDARRKKTSRLQTKWASTRRKW